MTDPRQHRGSEKLFEVAHHDHVAFARALTSARQDYQIKWWWKYGQPRIDLIRAVLEVKSSELGNVVTEVMALNRDGLQATLEAFPYGQPDPDMFRLDVKINRAM